MSLHEYQRNLDSLARDAATLVVFTVALSCGTGGIAVPLISFITGGRCEGDVRFSPTLHPDYMGIGCAAPGYFDVSAAYGPIPIPRVYQASFLVNAEGFGTVAAGVQWQQDRNGAPVYPFFGNFLPEK